MRSTALETAHVAVTNASAAWLDALAMAERAAQAAVTHLLASRSRLTLAFLSKRTPSHMAAQVLEEAHDLARGEILRSFPQHAVVGRHEGGIRPPLDEGPVWLVDALDGLAAYAAEKPGWAVTLALAVHGKLRLGVVIDGNTLEVYRGLAGMGLQIDRIRAARPTMPAALEGDGEVPVAKLLRSPQILPAPLGLLDDTGPSARRRFAEATAATIFPQPGAPYMASFSGEFGRASKAFKAVQRVSSVSLGLAQVATGRLDAFWAHHPHPCQTAAGHLLLAEAGAEARCRDGLPWHRTQSVSACTPALSYDFHPLLAGL